MCSKGSHRYLGFYSCSRESTHSHYILNIEMNIYNILDVKNSHMWGKGRARVGIRVGDFFCYPRGGFKISDDYWYRLM
jgi:hypothetical protein